MKILFSVSSFGFLRNFQSTIRLLAERGHAIHLIAERTDAIDGQKMVDSLKADHPSIEFEFVPSSRHRLWYALGTGVRASLDYWRYLDARWDHSPKLRRRAAEQAPAFAVAIGNLPVLGSRAGRALLVRLFHAIDRVLPPPVEVTDVFRRIQPDLMLLTPLLYFRSHQVDHVRSARLLGIKSILGVGSWDHLTTKGLIHEVPDRVLVWNEAQKREAIELHGVPADHVLVTGAQAYDHWFSTGPSVEREAFCRQVQLDPGRPFLLYLCSSPFIAPQEVGFVRRWIAAVRASADLRLRTAGLLVRPHPQNWKQWQDVDLAAEFDNVAFWPKTGREPDRRRRAQRLLRFHLPLRGGRRREHERDDRVRHHRPSGVHGAGGRIRGHAGRHAALPAPEERRRRARVPGADPRRTHRAARAHVEWRRRRASARARVHPGIHPPAWPRRRCDAAGRRRD